MSGCGSLPSSKRQRSRNKRGRGQRISRPCCKQKKKLSLQMKRNLTAQFASTQWSQGRELHSGTVSTGSASQSSTTASSFSMIVWFCRLCLKQSIMQSPDAEVKCPYKDNDYECNAPLPEREIKQVGPRATTPDPCHQVSSTASDEGGATGSVQERAAGGRECSCQQLPL